MMNPQDVQRACSQVGDAIANVINLQNNGVDATTVSMSTSMAALAMTASLIMKDFNPHKNQVPTSDHFLFAALLIWGSCQLEGDSKLKVSFSPEMLFDAIVNFQKFTGQNPRPILNPDMLKAIDEEIKVDRSSFGENSKFLPN